jgi:hypothetical protein
MSKYSTTNWANARQRWSIYVADHWGPGKARQLELLADLPDNPRMPAHPLSEWAAHREGCRVMRQVQAAARARMDRAADRALAQRQDALGDLFARAPKAGRGATVAFPRVAA